MKVRLSLEHGTRVAVYRTVCLCVKSNVKVPVQLTNCAGFIHSGAGVEFTEQFDGIKELKRNVRGICLSGTKKNQWRLMEVTGWRCSRVQIGLTA